MSCLFYSIVVIFSIIYFYTRLRKPSKYKFPPGPNGYPIIGNIHQLPTTHPFKKLSNWAYKYGSIYTIKLGTNPVVVINDPKLLRKLFSTTQSTGRFQTDANICVSQGPYGILGTEGQLWTEQRRLCLKTLKKFGLGERRMETQILLEAQSVCEWIEKSNTEINVKSESEHLLQIHPIFIQSAVNIIWSMVTNSKISLGDSQVYYLMKNFNDTLTYTLKTGLLFFPWLKYVAPSLSGFKAYNNACYDIHKLVIQEFTEHKQSLIKGAPRDLIDEYIEICGNSSVKMKHAVASVVELFIGGFDTMGSTLTWLFYYMSQNQELQRKLQDEIDKEIGKGEEPSLEHKSKMPFAEAVILETLRLSSVTPVGSLHRLLDDLEVEGYKLPKNTIPLANLYHCHYNKNVWGDPETFRPERFLESKGKGLKEYVVPFQMGKRQCLGEHLAMDIFFIYATKIFQQFIVIPDSSKKSEEYYKPDFGFLLVPKSLGLAFKSRSKEK